MHRLIIISGPSCSGKSSLAAFLTKRLGIPLFSKDDLKAVLFDTLGTKDREWSKLIGRASIAMKYFILKSLLASHHSVILESNFKPEYDRETIKALIDRHGPETIEIHCYADEAVLLERFIRRSESGERHPGHADAGNYEEARLNFVNRAIHSPLNLGRTIMFDTTDLKKVNYEIILAQL